MVAQAYREVLVNVKIQPDKANPAVLRSLGKTITDGQVGAHKAVTAGVEKETKKQLTAMEIAAREGVKIRKREEGEQRKAIMAGARDEERERAQRLRAIERYEGQKARMARSAAVQAKKDAKDLKEGFDLATTGALQLGRAFALAGGVGEKDMQKLLDLLLKIQIASDAISGGRMLAKGLGKIPAAKDFITGAAGGLAGRIGASGVGAGAGGAVAAFLAAVGSATVALTVFGQFVRDVSKYGLGGGATPGSLLDKIGDREASVAGWILRQDGLDPKATGSFAKMALSEDRTARMVKARQDRMAFEGQQEALARIEGQAAAQRRSLAMGASSQRRGLGRLNFLGEAVDNREALAGDLRGQEREEARAVREIRRIKAQQDQARERNQPLMQGFTQGDLQRANEEQERSLKEQVRLKQELLRADQERLRAQMDLTRATIAGLDSERRQLRSAKERFGSLRTSEQQDLIRIAENIRAGKKATPEELGRVEGFSRDLDRDISDRRITAADLGGFGKFAPDSERRTAQLEDEIEQQSEQFNDLRDALSKATKDQTRTIENLIGIVTRFSQSMVDFAAELEKNNLHKKTNANTVGQ